MPGVRFPIIRRPVRTDVAVVVSIPHYGTKSPDGTRADDFAERAYRRFPRGYADAFAAELYGDLDEAGATVLASPYSRLFVDLNRRRSDYETKDGTVRSERGVVRTHFVGGKPVFARPLTLAALERRLVDYYDPYHRLLDQLSEEMLSRFGSALVLDAHTGSEKGMKHHEVILGTRGGKTADPVLISAVTAVFEEHGFGVAHDVPGYSGGTIVRRLGADGPPALHAIQIEVNSRLLMACSRSEYFERIDRGEAPGADTRNLARLRACMHAVVHRAGAAVARLEP